MLPTGDKLWESIAMWIIFIVVFGAVLWFLGVWNVSELSFLLP